MHCQAACGGSADILFYFIFAGDMVPNFYFLSICAPTMRIPSVALYPSRIPCSLPMSRVRALFRFDLLCSAVGHVLHACFECGAENRESPRPFPQIGPYNPLALDGPRGLQNSSQCKCTALRPVTSTYWCGPLSRCRSDPAWVGPPVAGCSPPRLSGNITFRSYAPDMG